jgi:DNA-binding NarL/FixJ family response regulator
MPTRILIADDNPSVRWAMCEVLEAAGKWEVIEAENGEEAVAKAREFKPNLIILDLVMPGKDGLSASREIAKMQPGTPILMHTLYSSPQIQIEAAKTGVRKVVPKSEATALIAAVRDALSSDAPEVSSAGAGPAAADSEEVRERTEDRIRELCVQILSGNDDAALESMLLELRDSLHRHIESVRARLAEYPILTERRARNGVSQDATVDARKVKKPALLPRRFRSLMQ